MARLILKSVLCLSLAVLLVCDPVMARASWLSDATGINIDIPKGQISFGPPQPQAIVPMLQHLPQDAAQFFLNPAGDALAFAIRQAEALARNDCQPVPPAIQQALSPFFPPDIFAGVCWNTAGERFSIDTLLINDFNAGAVTLEDVIVFRDGNLASNPALWAHELTHVQQYRALGLETFAHLYSFGSAQAMENEAYSFQNFVQARLNSQNQQFWATTPNWDPQAQITSAQYQQGAMQVVNPFTCARKENYPGSVRVVNQCPIPIRVVGFIMLNTLSGAQAPLPCNSALCTLGPNTYSDWPEPAPWETAIGQIVW